MHDDHVQSSMSKYRLDHIVPEMEVLSLGSQAGNSNPPLATHTSKKNTVQNSSVPTVSTGTEVGGESTEKRQVAADGPPTRPGLANQPTGKVHPEFWS